MSTSENDPLILMRQSIASENPCLPTTAEDTVSSSSVSIDLSLTTAKFLQFTSPSQISLPLSTLTRFFSSDKPVNLLSIYFAWQERELAIPAYNDASSTLNKQRAIPGGPGGEIQKLSFVERVDLITWLEGGDEYSECIKALPSDVASATASARVASGVAGGIAPIAGSATGKNGRNIDPRLAVIYNGERKMGDRNSVLRGIKPTVRGLTSMVNGCMLTRSTGLLAC